MNRLLEFAGNHPLLVTAATVITVVIIVNELRLRLRGINEVGPQEATRLINDNALVVDVRNREQYERGHITSARNVPLAEIEQKLESLVKKGANRVILTCGEVGATGARAAALLKKSGCVQVANLKGGIGAWQKDNLPLVKKGK